MNTGFLGPTVATVPTVYGIETVLIVYNTILISVATVPTVYGIETPTYKLEYTSSCFGTQVATVPTVYGIETVTDSVGSRKASSLQQYLPFTVLKPALEGMLSRINCEQLQQYLPFTVLKLTPYLLYWIFLDSVATVPTVYGIET